MHDIIAIVTSRHNAAWRDIIMTSLHHLTPSRQPRLDLHLPGLVYLSTMIISPHQCHSKNAVGKFEQAE